MVQSNPFDLIGLELVEFWSSLNDLKLHWSFSQAIFQDGFASHGGLNKDARMAR
jgi:hypothetical protein